MIKDLDWENSTSQNVNLMFMVFICRPSKILFPLSDFQYIYSTTLLFDSPYNNKWKGATLIQFLSIQFGTVVIIFGPFSGP